MTDGWKFRKREGRAEAVAPNSSGSYVWLDDRDSLHVVSEDWEADRHVVIPGRVLQQLRARDKLARAGVSLRPRAKRAARKQGR